MACGLDAAGVPLTEITHGDGLGGGSQIHLLEGRTEPQQRAVIDKVTQGLVVAVGAPVNSVRVWIQEVPKGN